MLDAVERRRLLIALAGAAVLLAVGAIYASALRVPFLWDDHVLVQQEDVGYRVGSVPSLFTQPFWPETNANDAHVPYFRPLTLLTFLFDIALGATAETFHFTNVALHLVAVVLLAVSAARFGAKGPAAVLAALLWALAPRLTESVAWISGRTDVLAGVFGLGALAVTPLARTTDEPGDGRGWRLALSSALLLAALLAKESGLAFVLALMVAALRNERSRRSRVTFGAATAVPLAVYAGLRWFAFRHPSATRVSDLTVGARGVTVLEAVGRYAEMIVDPLRPRTSIGLVGEPDARRAALGAFVIVLLSTAAWLLRRRVRHGVVVGAALAVGGIGLVVHLAPLHLSGAVTADRLLYVPLAGVALAAAVAASALRRQSIPTAITIALAVAIVMAAATKARLDDYQSEARFWVAAAERAHPHNVAPLNGLAGAVGTTDDLALSCRLYDASRGVLAARGRTSTPAFRRTRENLAACWAKEGRYANALQLEAELVHDHPSSGRIRVALGYARLHLLDFDGAERAWNEALAVDPGVKKVVHRELTDLVGVRNDAVRFAAGPPTKADRWDFANFLAGVGRFPEADREFSRLALDPESSVAARRDATSFLVRYGSIGPAREAFEQWKGSADHDLELTALRRVLRARVLDQAAVTTLRPRIEALMTENRR